MRHSADVRVVTFIEIPEIVDAAVGVGVGVGVGVVLAFVDTDRAGDVLEAPNESVTT